MSFFNHDIWSTLSYEGCISTTVPASGFSNMSPCSAVLVGDCQTPERRATARADSSNDADQSHSTRDDVDDGTDDASGSSDDDDVSTDFCRLQHAFLLPLQRSVFEPGFLWPEVPVRRLLDVDADVGKIQRPIHRPAATNLSGLSPLADWIF